jgi:DNA-binding transcriptional LysR family regulator
MDSPPIRIELRDLRYFLAVSEELHFRRAAARLQMTQPPLSHAIRKLEDNLGVRLFERTSRTVVPTEAGRAFAESARAVLSSLDRAIAEVRTASGMASPLRIGYDPWLPIERIQWFLDRIHDRIPQSLLHPAELDRTKQTQLLSRGEIDLGIFQGFVHFDEFETEPILPGEALAVVLPAGHHLVSREIVTPDDLTEEALVVFPHTVDPDRHSWLLEQIENAGYRFRAVKEAAGSTPRDLVLAVAGGLGIGFAPQSVEQMNPSETLVVRRLLAPAVSAPDAVLAWQKRPSRQLQAIIGGIRELTREMRQGVAVTGTFHGRASLELPGHAAST